VAFLIDQDHDRAIADDPAGAPGAGPRGGGPDPARGAAVTLLDVARAAGVSRTTVSNAFNRPDQLSAALRERVLATARGLGYAGPNPVARMLRKGRVGAVGVVFTDGLLYTFSDPASLAFLGGVAEVCEPERTGVLIVPGTDTEASVALIQAAAVDGLVVYCCDTESPLPAAVAARGLPVVEVDSERVPGAPRILVDDRGGARAAAGHVLGLGHRRLGVLSLDLHHAPRAGPVDAARRASIAYDVTANRLAGYLEAAAAAGLDPEAVPIEECPGNEEAAARAGAMALLAREPRPTALLAMSDRLAAGALQAAAALGLAVPRDLSLVGFDDVPLAAQLTPPLTTVRQPLAEKGRLAAALLFRPAPPGERRVLPTALVVRGSTAPPPRAP
jgi:DNA-binding LacI/PurR family transcriptional regulator